jgi:alpha-L-rhamnosidase
MVIIPIEAHTTEECHPRTCRSGTEPPDNPLTLQMPVQIKSTITFLCCLALSLHASAQSPFSQNCRFIHPSFLEDSTNRPCPIFRKTFNVPRPISRATLLITAHGLYVATLNGQKIGTAWFTPGFTSYHRRLQYQQYDVAGQLFPGMNELQVTIGDGWWRGRFGADMHNDRYGHDAGLLAQLEITYTDGTRDTLITDTSWQCSTGPIRYADLYTGEVQDTRVVTGPWSAVKTGEGPGPNLVPTISEPVREHENFHPVRILTTPKGETVLDFGQNLAGWVRFTVNGQPGDTVRLMHAEALDSLGDFFTGNLRAAKAEDIYVLRGGPQTLSPHFTYHGFRYVKVIGYPGEIQADNFSSVALYTDLPETGSFTCSDPQLNQLQSNITWSQKSNFFDIPTDCPQRSERFGWAGDVQIFARTAAFNSNIKVFLEKWLADLAAEQGTNGGLPVFIPDYRFPDTVRPRGGVAGWGDAATILPWTLFEVYGDTNILRRQYPSMKAWVDHVHQQATVNGGLWQARGYGDWYSPTGPTDIGYIDMCFYAHSSSILAQTANILGNTGDAAAYTQLADSIRTRFVSTYFQHDSSLSNSQTAYVLALQFDLLPEAMRSEAAARLVWLIHQNNDHLGTGFLGTPGLLWVLSRYGYSDLAFALLKQTTPPSWLYPLSKGATTIWEKWDGIRPDGGFDTSSLNHYAYGAVGDWLYRYIAGIDAIEPGFRQIRIAPHPGGGLTRVNASYRCPYGAIVSNWTVENRRFKLTVVIPHHTTATIQLPREPGTSGRRVGPGRHHWTVPYIE